MAKSIYIRSVTTGGGGTAIDGIDGSAIIKSDVVFLVSTSTSMAGGGFAVYLATTAAQAEAAPKIIIPNSNPGSWNWRRVVPYST